MVIDVDACYEDATSYKKLPLYGDRFVVIVPKQHAFAGRNSIALNELRGQTLIVPAYAQRGFHSKFMRNIFKPDFIREVKINAVYSDPSEIPWHVNNGAGIAFTGGFTFTSLDDCDLVGIPIKDEKAAYNVSAIWKASNETPALRDCVALLSELVRRESFRKIIPSPTTSSPLQE